MFLEQKLEALLFYKGEPEKIGKLAELLGVEPRELEEALSALATTLSSRGVRVLRKDDEVALVTAPQMSELIETIRKEELVRDLGKAGTETLSIIVYQGPLSRAEIDYIRGVNSTFILRNLMIRGLIERVTNPENARSMLYKPTVELLQYLGVTKLEELPEFESVQKQLQEFAQQKEKQTALDA